MITNRDLYKSLVFPKVELISSLVGSGMNLVLNTIFRSAMRCMIAILPGPDVTLHLGVESHQDLQLEDIFVVLGKLPVLLVRQELGISPSLPS